LPLRLTPSLVRVLGNGDQLHLAPAWVHPVPRWGQRLLGPHDRPSRYENSYSRTYTIPSPRTGDQSRSHGGMQRPDQSRTDVRRTGDQSRIHGFWHVEDRIWRQPIAARPRGVVTPLVLIRGAVAASIRSSRLPNGKGPRRGPRIGARPCFCAATHPAS
jgi:hypothetical protein